MTAYDLGLVEHIHTCPYCPPGRDEWRHIGNKVTAVAGEPCMQHIDHGTECDGQKHSLCPDCRMAQTENLVREFVASQIKAN
jgi:hypothetical protein